MNFKYFQSILLIFFISLITGCVIVQRNVVLKVLPDKINYKLGDDVVIRYSFVNDSDLPVTILPWGRAYTSDKVIFYDSIGKVVKSVHLLEVHVKDRPELKDFITLSPTKDAEFKFTGRIKKGQIDYSWDQKGEFSGVYLDFGNSAVLLNGFGKYKACGEYKAFNEDEDVARRLAISNMLTHDLNSSCVNIVIEK